MQSCLWASLFPGYGTMRAYGGQWEIHRNLLECADDIRLDQTLKTLIVIYYESS